MPNKIRALSLFGGIGCFEMGLERAGVPFEVVDYVDNDKFAVKSYNAIWGTNYKPQDICKWDKNVECDLICHGSPCQSFSVAGLGAGGDEGSGTRSSLMWETVRIVEKISPKYIIWENVKGLLTKKHRHNFDAYLKTMENLGYKNYYQVMNAKNYGTPQNRERVFTISIREDVDRGFKFPDPTPLDKKLKDILEKEVDEKYYLSDKTIAGFVRRSEGNKTKGNGFRFEPTGGESYAHTATTKAGQRSTDNFIKEVGKLNIKGHDQIKRVYSSEGVAPTLTTMEGGNRQPKVIEEPSSLQRKVCDEALERGLVKPNDAIEYTFSNARLEEMDNGYISKLNKTDNQIMPTLRTRPQQIGVCVDEPQPVKRRRSEYGKKVRKDYENHELEHSEKMRENYIADDGAMPTITVSKREQTIAEPYIVASRGRGENNEQSLEPKFDGTTNTITSVQKDNYVATPYRIRKLTPKECWRLQSIDDEKFEKAKKAGVSNSQLYKQAGNGIAVCCPAAIFAQLFAF